MTQTDKSSPSVTTQLAGLVGIMTFSNPRRHNALSQDAWLSIPGAIDDLVAKNARVIILRGDGDCFCAGADISEFDEVRKDAQTAQVYERANSEAFAAIRHCQVPTIAQINGWCLGGGFGLASACDLRIADPSAQFSVPAAKIGLAYPVDAMGDIVSAVGPQMAKYLHYSGKRVDAETMLSAGFLLKVVAPDELAAEVRTCAEGIASLAPLTHQATKAAIAATSSNALKEAEKLGNRTFMSSDYAEGRTAFREKRPPKFTGK